MPIATARAPKTQKVECEILDEFQAAELIGLPIFLFREQSIPNLHGVSVAGLPGGIYREGKDYFVEVNQAKRLRAIRSSASVFEVFKREVDIERHAFEERERPVRESTARMDAKLAAEREQVRKEGEARAAARIAREARNRAAEFAGAGVNLS